MSEIVVQIEHANIYQSGSLILQDVNLNVQKGEFVYLVGKTGTGKSSLLKTLYGELTLTEGVGNVVGFNLKEMDWKKLPFLRRNLGVVFQDFQLLSTGWQDEQLIQQKVDDVLNKVGLQNKGFKMTYEMSGGEQQRVDIARAMLNSPKMILADEPTGSLDPETSDEIMQLLFQIAKEDGTAIIMATHDYMVVNKFPARTLTTEGGRLVEKG